MNDAREPSPYYPGNENPGATPYPTGNHDLPVVTQQRAETVERFNLTLATRDPTDLIGQPVDAFSLNFAQRLPDQAMRRAADLRAEIYGGVRHRVPGLVRGPLQALTVDYIDNHVPSEGARNYVRIRLETARGTRVTTLFRCFVSGGYLYVAADSYILGTVRVGAVILRALLTVAALVMVLATLIPFGLLTIPLFGLFFWNSWGAVVRGASAGRAGDGLRARYPKPTRDSSFDLDDVLMYLKTTLPSFIAVIREAGPRYGLDLRSLEDVLSDLTKRFSVAAPTIVNNSGTINGPILGGLLNTMQGK